MFFKKRINCHLCGITLRSKKNSKLCNNCLRIQTFINNRGILTIKNIIAEFESKNPHLPDYTY